MPMFLLTEWKMKRKKYVHLDTRQKLYNQHKPDTGFLHKKRRTTRNRRDVQGRMRLYIGTGAGRETGNARFCITAPEQRRAGALHGRT